MSESPADFQGRLKALRDSGARRYDPVRFRYLESLAERLAGSRHQEHKERLRAALDDFATGFQQARQEAGARLERQPPNEDREALRALLEQGDFKALHRLADRRAGASAGSPLTALLTALNRDDGDDEEQPDHSDTLATLLHQQQSRLRKLAGEPAAPPKRALKATRHLRATQARLHTETRIDRAIADTPGDAGPLNSHRLVTHAIERIRAISPAYLSRFAGHMEVLMVLEKMAR